MMQRKETGVTNELQIGCEDICWWMWWIIHLKC